MRTGIGYPSWVSDAVLTPAVGSWDTNFPLANSTDLIRTTNVSRATSTAQKEFKAIFSATRSIQLIALIGHNMTNAAAAVRVYGFSDNNPDPIGNAGHIVFDTGSLLVWPGGSAPVAGYRSIRPIVLSAAQSVRSLYFAVAAVDVNLELHGIEISGWWEWSGIGLGLQTGFLPSGQDKDLSGGAINTSDDWSPRQLTGAIDYLALGAAVNLAFDFQITNDLRQPFIFVEDIDTPTSWARTTLLVRHQAVDPLVGAVYRQDRFPVNFIEHRR